MVLASAHLQRMRHQEAVPLRDLHHMDGARNLKFGSADTEIGVPPAKDQVVISVLLQDLLVKISTAVAHFFDLPAAVECMAQFHAAQLLPQFKEDKSPAAYGDRIVEQDILP